ncbi:hypothetical protein BFJ69_g15807 [Fusarium oxysporum]|uniref:Peptidase A1 domain-containing protein n=1 Tax=Fusarium oxysporum TaxID=5507 RepID=A0A420MD31_FUSOX|nr:hypothetical protein BFJ69_g15807 [Fusarium oxysporum]
MEAIYQVQRQFRLDRGLTRISVKRNPHYQPHDTKSYIHLLNRFGFKPTKPGPYFQDRQIQQRGLAHPRFHAALGGRVYQTKILRKKLGTDGTLDADGTRIGEVTAEDVPFDSMYLCEVSIGTPLRSSIWTLTLDPQTFGYVTIGGVTIKNQTVELASQLDQQFARGKGDGLLGLAFPQINTVKTNWDSDPADTPVVNMINQHDIPKEAELFTSAFYSQRDANSPESFYTFGFIDTDLVARSGEEISLTYIDSSDGFWKFLSARFSVKGKIIDLSGNKAIADTSITLVLVSDEVCEALAMSSQESTNVEDLPEFKVAIGDKQFVIQPQDLVFAPADKDNWHGGIQSRGNLPFDIFGDAFLKSFYAIWDQGNKRFGVVLKIEETQNLDPTPIA